MTQKTLKVAVRLLLVFSFLCLSRMDDICGQDEISHYMKIGRQLTASGYSEPSALMVFSPHLYPLCLWGSSKLLGAANVFSLRLPGVLFWLALLICVVIIARKECPNLVLLLCITLPLACVAPLIVEIDQTILPLLTLLTVWVVDKWMEHVDSQGITWLIVASVMFCLMLWSRLSTPIVLAPMLIFFCWLRCRAWRHPALLAAALAFGGLLFAVSWYVYGCLTDVHWQGVYEYLFRSLRETTTGERSSGIVKLAQNALYMMFWGMNPCLLTVIACGLWTALKGLRKGSWHLSAETSIYLWCGVWLLVCFGVVGGALFGFPKYQTAAFPLIMLGVVMTGCRHWGWQTMTLNRRYCGFAAIILVIGIALFVTAGDPLYVLRVTMRESAVLGTGVPLKAIMAIAGYGFLCVVTAVLSWWLGRRWGNRPALLLLGGMMINLALLCVQHITLKPYALGYMYGDDGSTRDVARAIREMELSQPKLLVPHEVIEQLEEPELTYEFPFILGTPAELLERVKSKQPDVVAISLLANPANAVRNVLLDKELQEYFEQYYEARRMGQYWLWTKK